MSAISTYRQMRLRKPKLPRGEQGLNKLFDVYRRNAANCGREFSLNKEEFRELTSKPCSYCGSPPSQVSRPFSTSQSPASIEWGSYTYTGIDRVDNLSGYTAQNVRSCCRTCNFAKASMSETEFLAWIDRLISFRTKRTA